MFDSATILRNRSVDCQRDCYRARREEERGVTPTGTETEPPGGARDDGARTAAWLRTHGVEFATITHLVGDVSSRSYARIFARDGGTAIVARYPPELAPAQRRFRLAGELLAQAGIRVPRLLVDDPVAGYALVEDLGPRTLYEQASSWQAIPSELDAALVAAARIGGLDPVRVGELGCEPLGRELLARELARTLELVLEPLGAATAQLRSGLDRLIEELAALPAVACHRDFMARNLIATATGEIGVIDFQDLRPGPPGYDLASLLNDSIFATEELEERVLVAAGVERESRAGYERAVAQRCLKAVGTFVAFARTGRSRHLRLVPPTLERALVALERLPETRQAVAAVHSRLVDWGRQAASGAGAAGA